MKRLAYLVNILFGLLFAANAQSRSIQVEVKGVRNANGKILVMAQLDEASKPVYGLAEARKGSVSVTLENMSDEKYLISVFHDENGNWQLDMNEKGIPVEGMARDYYRYSSGEKPCVLRLYYISNDEPL